MENNIHTLEMSALLAALRDGRLNVAAATAASARKLQEAGHEILTEQAERAASASTKAIEEGRPRPLEGLPILADPEDELAKKLIQAGAIILGPSSQNAVSAIASGHIALAIGNFQPDTLEPNGLTGLWLEASRAIVSRSPQDIATVLRAIVALPTATAIKRISTTGSKDDDRMVRNALKLAADLLHGLGMGIEHHSTQKGGNDLNEQEALLAAVDAILLPQGTPLGRLPTLLMPAGYQKGGKAVMIRLVARSGNSEGLLETGVRLSKALGWKPSAG